VSTLLRYQFVIRRDQFWLPAALVGLFAVITAILGKYDYQLEAAASLLAVVLPLTAGILAASAIVEDPTRELQFAAPRAPWRWLVECSFVILGIIGVFSLVYQAWLAALGIDLASYGGLLARQLLWLIPTLALIALGSVSAALTAQGTLAALVVGGVWLFEIIARDWLASGYVGRRLLIIIGYVGRGAPATELLISYVVLTALSLALLAIAGWLLRRTERYI
jgi:hypothetical protein